MVIKIKLIHNTKQIITFLNLKEHLLHDDKSIDSKLLLQRNNFFRYKGFNHFFFHVIIISIDNICVNSVPKRNTLLLLFIELLFFELTIHHIFLIKVSSFRQEFLRFLATLFSIYNIKLNA